MKRFGFFLLLLIAFTVPTHMVAAQAKRVTQVAQAPASATAEDATLAVEPVEEKPEYVLPYPGVLPDSPLYAVKRLRDWILDKLIVDPFRRADFNILQADKRLNMGIFLIAKGNAVLAEDVVSKGEKYLNSAVYSLIALKNEQKEVPTYMVERLERSLEKHVEVLTDMVKSAPEAQKAGFEGSLKLVTKLQEELAKLK